MILYSSSLFYVPTESFRAYLISRWHSSLSDQSLHCRGTATASIFREEGLIIMADQNSVVDAVRQLAEGVHDIQNGDLKEGLHDIQAALHVFSHAAHGTDWASGLKELAEGVHDIRHGSVEEGQHDITLGLQALVDASQGTPFAEGIHDLQAGFDNILSGQTNTGYGQVFEGLHDQLVALGASNTDLPWA